MPYPFPDLRAACPVCGGAGCAVYRGYCTRLLFCPEMELSGELVIRTAFCRRYQRRFTLLPDFLIRFRRISRLSLEGLHEHFRSQQGQFQSAIDRYQISVRDYPGRQVSEETLDEFFLVTVERTVAKDCTVPLYGADYEVPPQYIGRRVELRFPQENPTEVFLYDNGVRIQKIGFVDSRLTGKTYQPTPRISDVALHEVMGQDRSRS